ncbi:MAG: hypothetical protein E7460_00960 [Ruminococcaceae bacterium]|nr:hypothetical protein [Oscillospiraceae bacterium]
MDRKTPYYAGEDFARMSRHDGGLLHAVGASTYQVMRANRAHPELSDGFGFTYNHAPMLTYWRSKFYLQYLSNEVSEHTGGGRSLLCISEDGIHWSFPKVSFPVIQVEPGVYHCADGTDITVPEKKDCFMHHRMAFFHSSDDRLLVTGFYGHTPYSHTAPWMNYGMGRAVREIYDNGELGPIYFIHYLSQSGWTPERLPFPVYTEAPDKGFVAACKELLADRLTTQQWSEEHGVDDECIKIKTPAAFPYPWEEAVTMDENTPLRSSPSFCWYHIDGDNIVGLWKHARVGRSCDGGETWDFRTEPSFVTSGAKAWGQKTPDGKFAIAYNNSIGSEHRYPLVAVTSEDGVRFDGMAVICGEVPPRRYEGTCKDFGPQYTRGICEGHREYPQGAMWLCHSMNKEDIAVTEVPVPIRRKVTEHVNDDFTDCTDGRVKNWNVYSTVWSPVTHHVLFDGTNCIRIADKDPCDYARAMRIFPESKQIRVSFDIMSAETYTEPLYIELADGEGNTACRVTLADRAVSARFSAYTHKVFDFPIAVGWHRLEIVADCRTNTYTLFLDGQETQRGGKKCFMQGVNRLERLIFRTKPARRLPDLEVMTDTPDLEGTDLPTKERIYFITNVKTESPQAL